MGRHCAACGSWCSNSTFSSNQWRKGDGHSRCKGCVEAGRQVQQRGRGAQPKPKTTSNIQPKRIGKENLKCSKGHYLQKHHSREEWILRLNCDHCNYDVSGSIWQEFYRCGQCNVDICIKCSPTQDDMNRIAPNVSQPRAVIQACCMVAIAMVPPEARLTAAARGERYNGRRPNYHGRRVSRSLYPDPTEFRWTFTGSCEGGRAEFFEKDFASSVGKVKLDFYYTTGTVKTVLDHPVQGVKQLFAKGDSLSPEMYRAILNNPRQHTGVRYHRRPQRGF